MPKTPLQIFKAKVDHLIASEKRLDKKVIAFQRKVYELLASEYLPLFEIVDGIVIDSPANDSLISKIDNYFNKLEKALYRDIIGPFAKDLLKSAELSANYYVSLGFKKTVVDKLLKNKGSVEKRLGIKPSGRLDKKGYLYKLGKTAKVRQELLKYVINNLTGETPFLDFQLGLRNLVVGNNRVKSLATEGNLRKYFDQFAYDTFNQMDAITNKQLATNLQLEHMVYEGSVIETTRKFCEKYAGKAFVVKDWVKKAKKDPDLIDKKTKSQYRPLIDRGRYRCRHFIRYITEELYKHFIANA